jgi:hypothetical protein
MDDTIARVREALRPLITQRVVRRLHQGSGGAVPSEPPSITVVLTPGANPQAEGEISKLLSDARIEVQLSIAMCGKPLGS